MVQDTEVGILITNMIIIIGDSFSVSNLRTLAHSYFYHFEESLYWRLRKQFPNERVLDWAQTGICMLSIMHNLKLGLGEDGSSYIGDFYQDFKKGEEPIHVICSWTDWTRSLDKKWKVWTGGYWKDHIFSPDSDPNELPNFSYQGSMYDKNIEKCLQNVQDTFIERWNAVEKFKHLRVYHWGGKCPVWLQRLNELTGHHEILYTDYANEISGSPSTNGIGCHHDFKSFNALHHFPDSNPAIAKNWDDLEKAKKQFTDKNPEFFPDSGHLSWKYYDKLVANVSSRIHG